VLTNLSNTSGQPNAVVVIQSGLQVQPVCLVDQNGNAVSPGGGGTATALATLTTAVVVSGSTAPTANQVLTAVSGSVATWQNSASGFTNPMTTAGDLIDGGSGGAAQRLGVGTVGQVLTVSSGTVPAWQAAPFTNPMTTPGDIIYESSGTAPTRLAGNTSTQREFLLSQGSGSAASAPTWSVVPGQYLCAPHAYAPGSKVSFTSTVPTFAAVASGTACTNTFTASSTGNVVVVASFNAQISASGGVAVFNLAALGTTTPTFGNTVAPSISGSGTGEHFMMQWYVMGLTSGSAYTFDLLQAVASGDTITVNANGTASTSSIGEPILLTVAASL
jgi:hypothetical protein